MGMQKYRPYSVKEKMLCAIFTNRSGDKKFVWVLICLIITVLSVTADGPLDQDELTDSIDSSKSREYESIDELNPNFVDADDVDENKEQEEIVPNKPQLLSGLYITQDY